MSDSLPFIVPFFGAAVLIASSISCCLWRRTERRYAIVMDRLSMLESRAASAPQQSVVQIPTPVYMAQPPPYRQNAPYYPPPVASAPAYTSVKI